ncbi:RagB/SusD family nutrient uptake outer membrane protein [Empedobacter brevis]|uniref:RagB/SusD family nutrient uptake outer membrane protein n=1 Tax=Empedobacter brevis TaxID=247 RepID=UPI0028AFFB75|nr:RagB/SusD family nutrient uptake outer membrane protein [Empedobacter brevis]
MKKRLFTITILTATILSFNVSCSDDFVEREFYQSVEQAPLTNYQEIQSFVRGAYASMRASTYYGADFLAYGELRSDNMFSNTNNGYYLNVQNYTMLSTDAYASGTWNQIYTMIAKTNIVINSDVANFTGTDIDRARSYYSQGQAYALRAQGFFDLLRLYGQKYTGGDLGIVLPLKYDPKAKMARATIAETEAQIIADFEKALSLMTNNTAPTGLTKADLAIPAVKGLMSRFYLYKGDYAKVRTLTDDLAASGYATPVAASGLAESFNYQFNNVASNSIFELAVGQVASLGTTSYAYRLQPNGYSNLQVKPGVVASLYTSTDVRKALINSNNYITGKYVDLNGTDNIKILRKEEIILNGVEAELNGGSPSKALTYYNSLITQRGLPAASNVTMEDLKKERAREFIGEGFRQWDLLRWGDQSYVPSSANKLHIAFPIPRAEININGTLILPNPGYEN